MAKDPNYPNGGPGGRPTKYKPEYCEQIIEFMAKGYSKTAFAGHIRVTPASIFDWAKAYPEFSIALQVAHGARVGALEDGLLNEDAGPRINARIFALKCACPQEWRETQDYRISGNPNAPLVVEVSDQDRIMALAAFLARSRALSDQHETIEHDPEDVPSAVSDENS